MNQDRTMPTIWATINEFLNQESVQTNFSPLLQSLISSRTNLPALKMLLQIKICIRLLSNLSGLWLWFVSIIRWSMKSMEAQFKWITSLTYTLTLKHCCTLNGKSVDEQYSFPKVHFYLSGCLPCSGGADVWSTQELNVASLPFTIFRTICANVIE